MAIIWGAVIFYDKITLNSKDNESCVLLVLVFKIAFVIKDTAKNASIVYDALQIEGLRSLCFHFISLTLGSLHGMRAGPYLSIT